MRIEDFNRQGLKDAYNVFKHLDKIKQQAIEKGEQEEKEKGAKEEQKQ